MAYVETHSSDGIIILQPAYFSQKKDEPKSVIAGQETSQKRTYRLASGPAAAKNNL
jgi:hypothetical protein